MSEAPKNGFRTRLQVVYELLPMRALHSMTHETNEDMGGLASTFRVGIEVGRAIADYHNVGIVKVKIVSVEVES